MYKFISYKVGEDIFELDYKDFINEEKEMLKYIKKNNIKDFKRLENNKSYKLNIF